MTTTQERLADALQPFVRLCNSEATQTIVVSCDDVKRARAALATHDAGQASIRERAEQIAIAAELGVSEANACMEIAAQQMQDEQATLPQTCNKHPDAPHGYDGWRSYDEDRYVCDCESWVQPEQAAPPEPVAWQWRFLRDEGYWSGWAQAVNERACKRLAEQHKANGIEYEYRALYAAPPAPRVSVPEVTPAMWKAGTNTASMSLAMVESANAYRARLIASLRAQGVEVVP